MSDKTDPDDIDVKIYAPFSCVDCGQEFESREELEEHETKHHPIVLYVILISLYYIENRKKTGDSSSHYGDQTIENLKNYYQVQDHQSSDLLRFIKTHETRHDSDDRENLINPH